VEVNLDSELERLRVQIAEGVNSLRNGEGVDGEAVFDRIDRELAALERQRK
jgi:hypothetical protein